MIEAMIIMFGAGLAIFVITVVIVALVPRDKNARINYQPTQIENRPVIDYRTIQTMQYYNDRYGYKTTDFNGSCNHKQ